MITKDLQLISGKSFAERKSFVIMAHINPHMRTIGTTRPFDHREALG
ncbi:MAG TPA: hypothetical protein VN714_08115 [Trebonia sp.]|jgi:hypothetical protein|nr:hypothetical protein [Trebonia sp.]